MKSPGISKNPNYQLDLERMNEKVEVRLDGEKIAETEHAIRLFEDGHDPVIYIPKSDIKNVDFVKYDDYQCPYKGGAELYTIKHGDHSYENAAWTYNNPYDEVSELQGRVAFYPDKVDSIQVH